MGLYQIAGLSVGVAAIASAVVVAAMQALRAFQMRGNTSAVLRTEGGMSMEMPKDQREYAGRHGKRAAK
jgi:hypothetical protein